MIKVRQIPKKVQAHSCDNCNRETSFVLEYTFEDKKGKEYNKITLCEDCANALSNLFYKVMEESESYKYEEDEFKKIPKTIEELGEELCRYCLLEENFRGSINNGNGPVFCSESNHCDEAYQIYLKECEEEI
ncbi:hypothetical protein [Clostridium sporogenes]|uniref:hypothetical protein n=1 Tax=Clostridium sporogenes TaxID=1509 RepID=UPI00024BB213|nr:hypothetical protein [Clostridium sporogenes]EHN14106.1 hypothetical protein IYC_16548 [Clostridium sporogenes PA 3679]MDU4596815.1 hypothetical protein [Clostridium sporogenes]NFQ34676.1 hypothetical protein [Clostridium sporogenes]NFQ60983.1 hypothetical protein [Clostridium sporogenes]NFU09005.1 hypothetical protein [Clostridium sporogenes]